MKITYQITRLEAPTSLVKVRDESLVRHKHWLQREQARWSRTGIPTASVVSEVSGQVALVQVSLKKGEKIPSVLHPYVLNHEQLEQLDKGRALELAEDHRRLAI